MKSMFLATALLAGCANQSANHAVQPPSWKVSYLCVGMESSKRFGQCAGCGLDARRITSLIRTCYGYEGETLVSEQATKQEVAKRLKAGIERTPEDGLFLFFYSGHGGQEALGGDEPDGSDSKDEFLCLYDTYMLDDEIWDAVSRCKGRVFLFFDACHSATMYRSVRAELADLKAGGSARALSGGTGDFETTKGFTFRPERFAKALPMSSGTPAPSPRILCWSGCKESEYSYGGSNGGLLTSAVVNGWKKGLSYEDLWNAAASAVMEREKTQHPVQTRVGLFQEGLEAFR